MTPVELAERIRAYDEKEKKEWFRTAWLASKIVSYLRGKSISVSDLLPEMFPPKEWTQVEIDKELKELKESLNMKD
ncbi:hypothetical protein KA005_34090 [bacterium]|nr:hypothetical protein [bacterium]